MKHGVAIAEGQEVLLNDPRGQADPRHSDHEQHAAALGATSDARGLFVSFTIRRNRVRVISARPRSRKERAIDEEVDKTKRG